MNKRKIEVFIAGCPVCDETVKLVESMMCPSCELQILNMRTDTTAQTKASVYGVKRVPTVVVDGKIADCCRQGAADKNTLLNLGVGRQH
jgi:glutaredoxin